VLPSFASFSLFTAASSHSGIWISFRGMVCVTSVLAIAGNQSYRGCASKRRAEARLGDAKQPTLACLQYWVLQVRSLANCDDRQVDCWQKPDWERTFETFHASGRIMMGRTGAPQDNGTAFENTITCPHQCILVLVESNQCPLRSAVVSAMLSHREPAFATKITDSKCSPPSR